MEISLASSPGSGPVNEDIVLAGERSVVVLDGATAEPGADTGCGHDVRWLVTRLGAGLGRRLADDHAGRVPLIRILREVIAEVCRFHEGDCDLTNPCSPSATVAILRHAAGRVDYLGLGDTAVVLGSTGCQPQAIVDDRVAAYAGRPWSLARAARNVPGGFWVAGAVPEAADHALTGSVTAADVGRAAVYTDGAYRLVERYGWSWRRLLDTTGDAGPAAVIAATRRAETGTAPGRYPGKHHDDATVALCRFNAQPDLADGQDRTP